MKQKLLIDISTVSIIRVVIVLLSLWFLYIIRDIIAVVFVSIIVSAAFSPVVDKLSKHKIPRGVTIAFIYLLGLGVMGAIVYFVLPPMISQLKQLANNLPNYFLVFSNFINNLNDYGSGNNWISSSQANLQSVSNFLGSFVNNIFSTTLGVINGATALVAIVILTLYFLLDENGIKRFFISLIPIKQQGKIISLANKVGLKLGGWLRGQVILAVTVGLVVYLGLLIIKMPYALTLGILAGALEIIPVIGPIIAAIPAILIAFTIAPTTALIITAFYVVVQELENKVLVPKVMQYAVGLNPITIIIIVLIGAKLMGILGILLSVPVAAVIYVILEEWPLLSDKK